MMFDLLFPVAPPALLASSAPPPKPAIIRPAEHSILRPGYFRPATRHERRAVIADLVRSKRLTVEEARWAIIFFPTLDDLARYGGLVGASFIPGMTGSVSSAVGWEAGWSPTLLADLSFWVDASNVASVTLNSGNVSYWASLGGDGPNGLQQATAGNQPPYTSGLYVDFAAASGRLLTIDGTWPSTFDCYFIGRSASSAAAFQVLLVGTNYQYIQRNSDNGIGGYVSGFIGYGGQTWPDATEGFALCRHTAGSGVIANRNGGSLSTASSNIGGPPTQVGNDATQPWGRLYEMVVTDAYLSTDDRQTVEGYLAWKWGLEGLLPVGHPYENEPP